MPQWPLRRGSIPPPPPPAASPPPRARPRASAGPAAAKRTDSRRRPGQEHAETPSSKRRRTTAHDPSMHGPATETRAEHEARHGVPGPSSCSRCRWYAMGDRWSKTVGAFSGPSAPARRSWIAERPARWGGDWGLGCSLCSLSLNRDRGAAASTESSRGTAERTRRYLCTKWARFEVRPSTLQAETFAQHQKSDIHKIALHA